MEVGAALAVGMSGSVARGTGVPAETIPHLRGPIQSCVCVPLRRAALFYSATVRIAVY